MTSASVAAPVGHVVRPGLRCLGWATFSLLLPILVAPVASDAALPGLPSWTANLLWAWSALPAIGFLAFYATSRLRLLDDGRFELSFFGGLRRHSLVRTDAVAMARVYMSGRGTVMYCYEIRERGGDAPIKCLTDLWSGDAMEQFARAVSLRIEREKPQWQVRWRGMLVYYLGPLVYVFGPLGVMMVLSNGSAR